MSEAAFRKKFARYHPSTFWVEPSLGSTMGLPDAIMAHDGQVIFAELKYDVAKKAEGLDFDLRPAQKHIIRQLHELKLAVVVFVQLDTGGLLVCRPGEWLYTSPRKISDGIATGNCAWIVLHRDAPSPWLWVQTREFLAREPRSVGRRAAATARARQVARRGAKTWARGPSCVVHETSVSNNKDLEGK